METANNIMANASQLALVTSVFITTMLIFNATTRKCSWKLSQGLLKIITPTAGNHDSHLSTAAAAVVWVLVVAGLGLAPLLTL